MVREANVKQANAEKQLKEALGKVRPHHSTSDQTVYLLTLRISVFSSDRRPPGGGSGSEDSRALLPDLPGG